MSDTDRELLIRIEAKLDRLLRESVPKYTDPADEDVNLLKRLLPGIAGKWGSAPFRTKEVFEDPVLSQLLSAKNRHEIGNMFRRSVGVPVDNYVVNRSVTESGARLWVVSLVCNSTSHQRPFNDNRPSGPMESR